MVRLSNHVPSVHIQNAIQRARHLGRMAANSQISLTVSLNLQNQDKLDELLTQLYDPKSAQFGKFLSSEQFAQNFYTSSSDIETISNYLLVQGLQIQERVGNTLRVSGTAQNIESAFGTEMHEYHVAEANGSLSLKFAASFEPLLRSDIAAKVSGIIGLNNFSSFVSHAHEAISSKGIGTGPGGGMTPNDIKKAYTITGTALGQTLALMELDGYLASDIAGYANVYGLPQVPLTNILIDGFSGAAGPGALEVVLDIELMMAVAPNAAKILVYEGINSSAGVLNTYARIANDNLAKQVSTSWGSPEQNNSAAFLQAENLIFKQMAAQGQSIYAASGDFGAFDNKSVLGVDDPASQPFVTAAGGTTLALNADGTYKSESSWGIAGAPGTGAGGGNSAFWPVQAWQAGFANSANMGISTMRMVPDVSANANPNTGYAVVFNGASGVVGGTSCVSPILAAMTAIINNARATNGVAPLGFANPSLYQLGQSSLASQVFRDIADASTNLFYPATPGYDLTTGLGSLNGVMFSALINPVLPPLPPGGLAVSGRNKLVSLSWVAAMGAQSYIVYRGPASTGPFAAVATNVVGTDFVDTGLSNGVSYFYYILAADSAGQSGKTAVMMGAPLSVVPQPPMSLSLKPVAGI